MWLHKGEAARSVATLTLGTIVAQTVNVSATPFLSRLYTPSEFGLLALMMAIIAVISTFVTLRYEVQIVVPKKNIKAKKLVLLSLVSAVMLGFFSLIIVWIVPEDVTRALGFNELEGWVVYACALGVVVSIFNIANQWLSRLRQFSQLAKLRVTQSVLFSGVAIILGFLAFKNGLLVAHALSLILVMLIASRNLPIFRNRNSRNLSHVAKEFDSAPKYMLPTALFDVLTMQLPVVLISIWFGSTLAGEFSLAWRVLFLPMSLVGVAVGQVFYQRFACVWPDARASLALLIRVWRVLAILGLLPLIVIFFYGENLFSVVFGANWSNSGKMAAFMAPMLFMSLIHSPTSTAAIVLGVQKNVLYISLIILIYRPLSLYVGWKFDDIYLGLSIFVIFEIFQMIFFQIMIYKEIKKKLLPSNFC